jgi:two-component system cell cycle response regulator
MDKTSNRRVLIVDDSEFNLELVKALITVENDLDFIDACDGKEAVDKFVKFDPDLVILDIMMPNMGGVETLRIMKKINATIPIIILTAVENDKTKNTCMDLGVSGYFIKPLNSNKLSILVKQLLTLN